jgi:hypothetical protein
MTYKWYQKAYMYPATIAFLLVVYVVLKSGELR